jgi:hypothetical protein
MVVGLLDHAYLHQTMSLSMAEEYIEEVIVGQCIASLVVNVLVATEERLWVDHLQFLQMVDKREDWETPFLVAHYARPEVQT